MSTYINMIHESCWSTVWCLSCNRSEFIVTSKTEGREYISDFENENVKCYVEYKDRHVSYILWYAKKDQKKKKFGLLLRQYSTSRIARCASPITRTRSTLGALFYFFFNFFFLLILLCGVLSLRVDYKQRSMHITKYEKNNLPFATGFKPKVFWSRCVFCWIFHKRKIKILRVKILFSLWEYCKERKFCLLIYIDH